ncbi:LRR receptor-like serine/threonine-protein kinase [Pyrus ussuriensis x Pyrus communis]|uniref:LRR receptor-like serine/threonine-protein kinase n=1 Tax=Pyrus ussuriensis x Pyrus communis TaxID=2448454 RepID=A0A5N5GX49_9ROSA|nr:LRR receptor-like serine/threonine-protein kinase [Pyrus ussuriensis x Pyrus communis]KAB2621891.1 LRR receptor-like serine/threonine-protein kinase [Pyrus ussuriensis x Pyrus communis]
MLFHNLTYLTELYLDGVNISAQGNEWVLRLSNTLLSGPVDKSLAKLQSLSVIQLDRNDISGLIPRFFANFSNMRVFSWGGNNISALQF